MWSLSQSLGGDGAAGGTTQWPSRSSTSSRIHAGGSCWSTASRRAMFRTGWMTTWEWPTHWRSLAMVAAPRRSTAPVAKAAPSSASTSRSSASTRTWSLNLPGGLLGCRAEDGRDVEGGLSGHDGVDESDGFDLADAEGVGVAVDPELVGDGADQVVEGLEDQGVAAGGKVAVPDVEGRVGVADLDVRGGGGVLLTLLLLLGVVLRDREGDQPVGDDRPEGAVGAGRRGVGRPSGRRPAGGCGSVGRRGGPARPAPQAAYAFPQQGEAVA